MYVSDPYRHRFPGAAPDWARFDAPGGTQMLGTAIEAMSTYMSDGSFANDHGFFEASHRSDEVLEEARTNVATLIGASPDTVVFNNSSTAHIFNLTRALASNWHPGDEIICTQLDHDSNIAPWMLAARDAGAHVRLARVDPLTGFLDADQFAELITDRTRWVAVTAASNALGMMPDVKRIVQLAHEKEALVLVDAVAMTPHRPVRVRDLGCDALVTSPYKWYGPHSGVMWLRSEVMAGLPAYQIRPAHADGPSKFEQGTTPFEVLAGVSSAAVFLQDVTYEAIDHHETSVFAPLLDGLRGIEGVTVYGHPERAGDRTPTVAFNVDGLHPDKVAEALGRARVAVWTGNFYALELTRAMGVEDSGGFVRAGVALYTSPEDVARLLDVVTGLVGAGR